MKDPGFLVLDGGYEEQTDQTLLYVRPMGTDAYFTVSAITHSQSIVDRIKGKVIIVNYICDNDGTVKPSMTKEKKFHLPNPLFKNKGLGMAESFIQLTGQYIEKLTNDEGRDLFVIDTVFPLTFGFTCGHGEPGKLGDWIELELTLSISFDEVVTIDEWIRFNPDKK
jgi:hypothetical protein